MSEIIDVDGDSLTVESDFGYLWISCSDPQGACLNPAMARQLRIEIDLYLSSVPLPVPDLTRVRRPRHSRKQARNG